MYLGSIFKKHYTLFTKLFFSTIGKQIQNFMNITSIWKIHFDWTNLNLFVIHLYDLEILECVGAHKGGFIKKKRPNFYKSSETNATLSVGIEDRKGICH